MEPMFIGEVSLFAGNFAPRNWAFCNGALLPIAQYTALFSIIGTTYGGDGRTTFGLPNLNGRTAVHEGTGPGLPSIRLGQMGGQETQQLTLAQMPAHNHSIAASVNFRSEAGDETSPNGGSLSVAPIQMYHADGPSANATMSSGTITATASGTGNGTPFSNQDPYLGLRYIIALVGTYPSRS